MKRILILLLLLPGFACFAQRVSLALNLKKDSTYYLKTTNILGVKQNIQGQQIDVNTTIYADIANKVLTVHDTVYNMKVAYTKMRMSVTAMGQTMEFNSEDKGDSKSDLGGLSAMMGKMLNAMLNKPFFMELSKTGHILSIKNVDTLFESMFNQFPQLTAEQKVQFKVQMEKSFGETSIKNSFQMTFPMFPVQKVGVSNKWTGTSMLQTTVTATINTTYTLNQITDKAYMVSGDGIITGDKNAAPAAVSGMTTSFTGLTGKINTDFAFDKKTCWILSSKTKETISGTANVKTPTGQEVSYPIEIVGDISVLP